MGVLRQVVLALIVLKMAPESLHAATAQGFGVSDFFNGATVANMRHKVEGFYAPDCVFEDPLVRIEGRERIVAYYQSLYKDLTQIRFEFTSELRQGDEGFAAWIMHINTPNLRSGQTVSVPGASQFRFLADKVTYHRDYFDLGAMVYEHIPVVGWLTRRIKARLALGVPQS